MGKNAGHKAMQAQRYASSGAGGGEDAAPGAPPTTASVHQEADVTYHTPEWHAARIAALTSTRMSWDDFRKQQRDLQAKEDALVGSEKAVREHRALLDAERAARLGRAPGAAVAGKEPESKKKRKSKDRERSKSKDKDKKKRKKSKDKKDKKKSKSKSSKRKRRRGSDSGSGSDSSSSSDSSDSDSGGGHGEERQRGAKAAKTDDGPIKLSEYLRS